MKESWKYIKGLNKMYQISNLGRVKTFQPRYKTSRILKPGLGGNGYLTVSLKKPDNSKRTFYIHRLLAEHFIPNPNKRTCINHIDGIKTNNDIENLEWITHGENNSHAIRIGLKKSIHPARGLVQLDLEGNEIARFKTSEDVPGIPSGNICRAANNQRLTAGGFKWKFIN